MQYCENLDNLDRKELIKIGCDLIQKEHYGQAIKYYKKCDATFPNDAHVLSELGWCYMCLGMYQEAIKYFDRAQRIYPNCADIWKRRGLCQREMGFLVNSIVCYNEALKINDRLYLVHFEKAVSYTFLGQSHRALECYDMAIDSKPNFSVAYYNKGIVLQGLKMYSEAINCYKMAHALNKSNVEALYWVGICYYHSGFKDLAYNSYVSLLKEKPNHAKALFNKAAIEIERDNYPLALESISEFLKIVPDEDIYREMKINAQRFVQDQDEMKRIAMIKKLNDLME